MNEDTEIMSTTAVSEKNHSTQNNHSQDTITRTRPVIVVNWAAWLQQNGSKLLLFARQQTRSMADAEDVLQEALVKLAKKEAEGTFDGGQASWLPYLYTSIRRCAIDLGRKEDRRGKREEKSETNKIIQYGEYADPWFESDNANDEARIYLERGLKKLPEKFASVITLKIWGELTFAEIGKKLNISQNTAASRYRYGLENLKKHLARMRQNGNL